MKLGILGGTFSPVHFGHLVMADAARIVLGLHEIRFVPNRISPLKTDQILPDGHARADMLRLAVSGYPEFVVDRREIRRDGVSYTVDTLTEFAAEFPEAELFFLLGADALHDFPQWRDPRRIADLAWIVAANRPGHPPLSADWIHSQVGPEIAARVIPLEMPGCDISSTAIRERLRNGTGARFLLPRAVEEYAVQHALYASGSAS